MKITENLHAFIWQNSTTNNCNSYFINGKKKILIDPGHKRLFGHVKEGLAGLSLSPDDIDVIIITHCHPDHIEAVTLFEKTSAMIAFSKMEMAFLREIGPQYSEVFEIPDLEPDIFFQEGELDIGDITFEIIHTPGHSPGSICLYWVENKVLFTGDVVFDNGIGRTDIPGAYGNKLKDSIINISRLEINYLLPGHGETITGSEPVRNNFKKIKDFWFAYL